MRRLLVILLVLAFVTPAVADSKLSVSGEYDVASYTADNVSAQNLSPQGVDDLGDADALSFLRQRFRVQTRFRPSDKVSATLRADFAEGIFGQDQGFAAVRASDASELQIDRAYVDVNPGLVRIQAGLQFIWLGQSQVFRDNQPGIQIDIKTPVNIRLGYVKVNEGIGVATALSDDGDENKDTDRYFIDLGYRFGETSINAFYWMQTDGGTGDSDGDGIVDNFEDEPTLFGVYVRSKMGALSWHAELASFGGDNGNGSDYAGTQVNFNGRYKVSDALTVSADLFYSNSADADEIKLVRVGNPFAAYDIKWGEAMGWGSITHYRTLAPIFTSGPPGGPLPGGVFDPYSTGSGSIGGGIGAKFLPADKWHLIGQLHYMTAEDNDRGITNDFDSAYHILLVAGYHLTPSTTLSALYELTDASFTDDVDPDPSTIYALRLHVDF